MNLRMPDNIYIASTNVDIRKSIDGLSAIVNSVFRLDTMSDSMFVFHNRNCDKVKILYWDTEGFCLLYKRLERDKFRFPKRIEEPVYTVTNEEIMWLLHGLHFEELRKFNKLKKK